MRRRTVRPFGSSLSASRAMSMLVGLAVLWVMYDTIRQPTAWGWLAAGEDDLLAQAPVAPVPGAELLDENVSPGPNDLDPEAFQHFQEIAELITDKTKLHSREMMAYWQLLGWSRTQPFAEFEQRAQRDLILTQIWEEPQKYRGKPVRLRLHVRRVLEWGLESEKNPLKVPKVYEAMGWTDESKSLPYTIVFTEKPPGLPIGSNVEAEVVFVGYFLKILAYDAFDAKRGTPLLMGRVRVIPSTRKATVAISPWEIGGLVLGGVLLIPLGYWYLRKSRPHNRVTDLTHTETDPQWVPFQDPAPLSITEFDPTRVGSPVGAALEESPAPDNIPPSPQTPSKS